MVQSCWISWYVNAYCIQLFKSHISCHAFLSHVVSVLAPGEVGYIFDVSQLCGSVAWCHVLWCGVVWMGCAAVWCHVLWCGCAVLRCGVLCCAVLCCGCGVLWCRCGSVVWCAVLWVWCGVMWSGSLLVWPESCKWCKLNVLQSLLNVLIISSN